MAIQLKLDKHPKDLEGYICHGGSSPLLHLIDLKQFRKVNVWLTKQILRVCSDTSITNQVLYNEYTCRQLNNLLKVFTPRELIELAKHYSIAYPWSIEYDTLKILPNQRFILLPLIIAFPETTQEVQYFVCMARLKGLKLSIRSGGHSAEGYAGSGDLVIDMSLMKLDSTCRHSNKDQYSERITVDTSSNTLTMAAGVPLGVFYTVLTQHNRITPAGTCPGVSSGLILGGGIGGLVRRFGLSCDQVLNAKVVLSDGSIINANSCNHSELFTALRGGGNGNFGVVTELTMQVHDMSHLVYFEFIWDISNPCLPSVLAKWHNNFVNHAPRSVLGTHLRLNTTTNTASVVGWFLDEHCYAQNYSPDEQVELAINTIREYWFDYKHVEILPLCSINDCNQPGTATIKYVPVIEAIQLGGGNQPQILPFYKARSFFALQTISEVGFTHILRFIRDNKPFADNMDGVSIILFDGFGQRSAANDEKLYDTTVFLTRKSNSWMLNYTFWRLQSMEEQGMAYSQKLNDELRPYFSDISYYNWQDNLLLESGGQRYLDNYFAKHVELLRKVKEVYDPDHIFSYPLGVSQNVRRGLDV